MAVQVGDKIPEASVKVMSDQGPKDLSTAEIFAGKKVVLFALPGAYTPTCSAAHLPGFVVNADKIKEKGVDSIVCLSVNDPFVMASWGAEKNAEELIMAADWNADFTSAMGLEMDGSAFGLGKRSQRYSMVVEDSVITALNVEQGSSFEASTADKILENL
ncbi:MAG: peroxiredoxin [Flavobacterium sp.]|jgi:peroxiredoxin